MSNEDLFHRNLKKGDLVWWSDPGEDLSSGVYTVNEVYADPEDGERFSDTMVTIFNKAGGEAEVELHELCAVPADLPPPIPGLEGPFRYKTEFVLYWDPKEWRYYDRGKDLYLSIEEVESAIGIRGRRFNR
jgi:hypothetical protein